MAAPPGLPDYESQIIAEHYALMKRLDLHHGTPVEFSEINPDGTHRIEWIDAHGTPRATSVAPEFFAANFTRHPENVLPGDIATGSMRQEADYERGEFHREGRIRPDGAPDRNPCEACGKNQDALAEARVANGGI